MESQSKVNKKRRGLFGVRRSKQPTRPEHSNQSEANLSCVPAEILLQIFSFISSPRDLCNLSCVNRVFHVTSSEPSLWKPLCSPRWVEKNGENTNWKLKYLEFLQKALFKYTHGLGYTDDTTLRIPSEEWEEDQVLKIVFVGALSSGKSCLLLRYVDDRFYENFRPTIGEDFKKRTCQVHGKRVQLQLYDTAGQERFREYLPRPFYRLAVGMILVYDVQDRRSFEAVRKWHDDIKRNLTNLWTSVMLVGNKIDLMGNDGKNSMRDEKNRQVSREEGEALAEALGIPLFAETSARTGEGAAEALTSLLEHIYFVSGNSRAKAPSDKDWFWNFCVRLVSQRGVPKVVPSVEDLDASKIECFYKLDEQDSKCIFC